VNGTAAMLKVELHNHGAQRDPVPCFATNTEIEIAEQLRHQLEKRLLAPFISPAPSAAPSSGAPAEAPTPSPCHGSEGEQL